MLKLSRVPKADFNSFQNFVDLNQTQLTMEYHVIGQSRSHIVQLVDPWNSQAGLVRNKLTL